MSPQQGRSWVGRALRAGLTSAAVVPAGIVLGQLFPQLLFGYPLVLLPLLVTGPAATYGLRPASALLAAALAGLVAALLASASLAVGSQVLGVFQWGLTSPAAAPPMPPLPRVALFPPTLMSWAQQDLLILEPLVALLLGALFVAAREALVVLAQRFGWTIGPRSLGRRLAIAFGGLTLLTFVVGWVAFGALEEMHFRAHRLQLQGDWQGHLSDAQMALNAESDARLAGVDPAPSAALVDATYAHLSAATMHREIALGAADFAATAARYRPALEAAQAAHAAFDGAQPADPLAAARALGALDTLRAAVDDDMGTLLDTGNLAQHERLVWIMLAVGLAGAIGLWLNQQVVASITRPIRELGDHLRRVAQGDFSVRLPLHGPVELRRLVKAVNHMTGELDRLYAAERAGRATAEAMATRERELAAAKEFWANTVVHDLKGPLSIISGYAEMLDSGLLGRLDERQRQAIEEMHRAATDLTALATDINDSFRLESEALPMRPTPVDAAVLLWEAAREQSRPDGGTPRVRAEDGLPPVLADARLVRRVLKNLVGNAYKHAGSEASVTLWARAVETDQGPVVHFTVEDDGPGIAPEHREWIFERFAQGDGAGPGSGLGLAFCKLVVERHGGRIWVDPQPRARGARISFWLPAAPADAASAASATFRRPSTVAA